MAGTEDSSEATNDSLSVVINSEETSRDLTTNGNGTGTNENTNDTAASNGPTVTADEPNNVAVGETEQTNVYEAEDANLEPSSKKIRLEPLETEEGAA